MKYIALAVIFGLGLVGLAAGLAQAGASGGEVRLDPRRAVERSEQAIGRRLGDYQLIDSTSARLALRDYRGKPLVISLVYTACSSVCPPTTQNLIRAVREASRIFGTDAFNVLTVGFDARNDTPARLSQFSAAQGIRFRNWRLASADPATIEALLRDLGFSYAAVAGGFQHVTQTTILDGEGRIIRHVYGDEFPLQMLIEPLKDIVFGSSVPSTVAGFLDRVKFICTVYDPGAGRYRIDYGLVFGGTLAALSLLVFGGLIFREWTRAAHG